MPRRSHKKGLSKKAKGKQPMPSEDKAAPLIDPNPDHFTLGNSPSSNFPSTPDPTSQNYHLNIQRHHRSDQTPAAPCSSHSYPPHPPPPSALFKPLCRCRSSPTGSNALFKPFCRCRSSPTGSNEEPSMAGDSISEVPSSLRSEKAEETSEGDLPDWADTMLEKIDLLEAEFGKLRDAYRESQRENLILRFKLSCVTEIDRMRDFEKALTRVAAGCSTSEEFDSADLKMFQEYLWAKKCADENKKRKEE
ncbi:hypothetical protein N7486_002339 [Penicillium sp. IBT 16267x]|nr:hypothetical protein N7486_002339 [Penicillium sp. IBT 16267x]